MKRFLKITSIFFLITLFLINSKCDDQDDQIIPITITASNFTTTISENPNNTQSLGVLSAIVNQGTLTYSLNTQSPNGAFNLNSSTGELSVADSSLFDFETNPILTAVANISAGDVSENIDITITLNNVIEFNVSNFTLTISENPNNKQILGSVLVDTEELPVIFSLRQQSPSGAFMIDSLTGELSVADSSLFNFETNPILTAVANISVGDVSENIDITITLNNVIELNVSNFTLTIAENPNNKQILGSVLVDTEEVSVIFSLRQQSPSGAFMIDSLTGELSVADSSLFDFEANTSLTATAVVVTGNVSREATITITITDVLDITVSDFTLNINENINNGQSIGILPSANNQGTVTFSLTSQMPAGAFSLSSIGELFVADSSLFDFEINQTISAVIVASNGTLNQTVNLTIDINDLIDMGTIWTGPLITFERLAGVDWTLEENQDRISDSVWITRQNRMSIFNIRTEMFYSASVSPQDTEWAFGTTTGTNLVFSNWINTVGRSSAAVNRDMVLHLISEDIYIDIKFLIFSSGGIFTYQRSSP